MSSSDNNITNVIVVYGGELAQDVAAQIEQTKPEGNVTVVVQSASERPKKLLDTHANDNTVVCFVMQTIENAAPTEDGGTTVRFFARKTHPTDLCASLRFAVLGLGDSNLLLDRQTTSAKDCNQVAQGLHARLQALGGAPHVPLGMADERTGLTEVEPWIADFWKSFA